MLDAGCKASYESNDGDNALSMVTEAKNKGSIKLIKKVNIIMSTHQCDPSRHYPQFDVIVTIGTDRRGSD